MIMTIYRLCLKAEPILYRLDETLKEYEAVQAIIPPVLVPLMEPFKERVETALRPGLITHTWSSLNFQNCECFVMRTISIIIDR